MEVTELEAEKEHFCISPCCTEMWEVVEFFASSEAKTATPKVKSQQKVTHFIYLFWCVCMYVYVHIHCAHTHTKVGIKRVYVTAAALCMRASVQVCRVGAMQ